jgi:hypothetical protein
MLITAGVILLLAILLAPILLIRFRKRWVAAFNLAVTNRITSPFADRLPGLRHPRACRSEVRQGLPDSSECFSRAGGFLIALTYGRESEWVKNVLAAGGCEPETRAVRYQLFAPTVVHDPTRRRFR